MSRPDGRRSLRAPAKVNLGLRIVGRRPDGYHLLESVFAPLDLADDVELAVLAAGRPGVALRVEGGPPDLEAGASNLAARAARAWLEASGCEARVELVLRKRIPVGAGLGGGSSDAAAVLRGLQQRPEALPEAALAALALRLGADVPFFLDPRPARVGGIGERIEPLEQFPGLWLLLATPGPPLATTAVYAAFDASAGSGALTPSEPALRMRRFPALESGGPGGLQSALAAGLLANDLEPAATRLRPSIGRTRERLGALGAADVGMSGSGPTLFGIFPDERAARRAREEGDWETDIALHVARVPAVPDATAQSAVSRR